jgi:hypothetical protein
MLGQCWGNPEVRQQSAMRRRWGSIRRHWRRDVHRGERLHPECSELGDDRGHISDERVDIHRDDSGQMDPATESMAAPEYLSQGAQYLQSNGIKPDGAGRTRLL